MKQYHVDQFTPMDTTVSNYGKWTVWQVIASVPAGENKDIFGNTVIVTMPTRMSEHVPGVPYFNTKHEAEEAMLGLPRN